VARGYRCPTSFAAEQEAVRSVLATAGVVVTTEPTDRHRLDPALDAVLAVVLREGTANVIRHSEARNCHVTLSAADGSARLVMVNDGGPVRRRTPRRSWTGQFQRCDPSTLTRRWPKATGVEEQTAVE
jgi:two-component system sensor histidine kinase DesK